MTLQLPTRPPSPLGRGTLGRHLVIRVAAIVAIAALMLSTAAFVAVRQILISKADQQLLAIAGRPQGRPDLGSRGPRIAGLPVGGILINVDPSGTVATAQILSENNTAPIPPDDALNQLLAYRTKPGRYNVKLEGLGSYRVSVQTSQSGAQIVAIPLSDVNRAVSEMTVSLALLTLLAIAAAVVATQLVVAKALRPLHEVATVATDVGRLELDRGEVDLGLRVPPENANPTNEVGRVGAALNHMLNNVESALAARQASETQIRQFVADASHELRNPLAAIRGYAELTRRHRDELPPDTQFAMSRIESESERMSRLVEDMLLLARLDTGPELNVGVVEVGELVVNAVADARVAGPDHVWRLAVPKTPVEVMGDRYRLHQVVANLLSNARTHTPAGTIVTASVEVDAGSAVIRVADNGPGIPPEIQPKVFERFVRADASRVRKQGQSTGLGLSIVQAVVARHDGRVSVTSEPGNTVFEVRLKHR